MVNVKGLDQNCGYILGLTFKNSIPTTTIQLNIKKKATPMETNIVTGVYIHVHTIRQACCYWKLGFITPICLLSPISQRIHELIIQILWNAFALAFI